MSDIEKEKRKKAIFESMSEKRRQKILKKGYDRWDPFMQPKEPSRFLNIPGGINSKMGSTLISLLNRFEREHQVQRYDKEYLSGAREICMGLSRGDRRYQGMYAFCTWISDKLKDFIE